MANIIYYTTIAVIIGFIVLDIIKGPRLKPGIWIPFAWITISASKPLTYWINPMLQVQDHVAFDYAAGSPVDRMFFMILIALGIITLLSRKLSWSKIFSNNKALMILIAYMFVTVLWSGYRSVTIKRWIKLVGDLVMVLIILSEDDPVKTIEHLFRRCALILLPLSLVFIKYFRIIGVNYTYDGSMEMWLGVTRHKNSLGELASFTGVILVWMIIKNLPRNVKKIDIVLLLMAVLLLAGSKTSRSSTSLGVFLLGSMIIVVLHFYRKRIEKVNGFIITVLVTLLVTQLMVSLFTGKTLLEFVVSLTGKDMTLTGRTPLWAEMIKISGKHPFIGSGFGAWWVVNMDHMWDAFTWDPTSGHSGYIDMFVNTGFFGIVLMIVMIIATYRKVLRTVRINFDYGRLQMALLVMVIIHNITETSLVKPNAFLWILFLLVAAHIPQASMKEEKIDITLTRVSPDNQVEPA
jgi:exopolysaccharide production protein ExoQ